MSELRYSLSEEVSRRRARAMAAWMAVAIAMPPVLVVGMVIEMKLAELRFVVPIALLVVVLAVVRGVIGYRASVRRLRAFVVELEDAAMVVRTLRATTRIARAEVSRILDVTGALGGLRLELRGREDAVQRFDIPRGGEGYAELRGALAAWMPIEPTRRRGRIARVGFGVAVILAIFFMPFFVVDVVARSRVAACAVILALWIAMRSAIARGA